MKVNKKPYITNSAPTTYDAPISIKPISKPRTPYLCESAPITTPESPPKRNANTVNIPTEVDLYCAGTTSKSVACVFTSKNPRKTPYAAVIAIIAAADGISPIATRHGAPHSIETNWKAMRKRGILFTNRSVRTPPARIAANAKRWCQSIVCVPASPTVVPNFVAMYFGAQKR